MNSVTRKSNANRASNIIVGLLKKYAIILVLIGLIILFSIWSPYFFTRQNLTNVFVQQSYVIIAAVGLSFVMISGGMDLSIGYQMSLVGVTIAVLMKWFAWPIPLAILAGILLGIVLGLINGIASIKLKVHPLIITLGTMTVFQGVSYIVSNQSVILNLDPKFKYIGQGYLFELIPVSVILMVVVIVSARFYLTALILVGIFTQLVEMRRQQD